ncbi:hypothetical protein GHJ67_14935, partial [Enterococcus faecium]|nr:hypothetical protein [Enterococcus faecium]MCZ2061715.1 hypothetical protein [Enterococcus faecium]MCZ2302721.1 hypothetical protein [Enterococcus faecium]MCZ2360587.1 hypothetical protein [Enterococcus faecium]
MNILNEKRYVWFAGKKYITTFKRLSELMQQTVKSAMPEGYKFNRIRQKSPILYRWVMNAVRYEGYR